MKILVIGELCRDVFVYGETKRLSPEAPIPIFIPTHTKKNDGMGGNVVNNLKAIGSTQDIEIEHIHQQEIITKTRYVDDKTNHMFLRVDEGDENITPLLITTELYKKISQNDVVIVSDYNKGFLSNEALCEIGKRSKFSIIDTKRNVTADFMQYFNFVKVNEDEFNRNQNLLIDYLPKTLITLGRDGVRYMDKRIPSPAPKDTIDVSGAGDTFTAAFVINYMKTNDIKDSIYHANLMSSIVVSKRGVVTP